MTLQKPDILIAVILILLTTLFVMKLIKKIIVSMITIGIVTAAIFLFMQTEVYRQRIMPTINSLLGTEAPDSGRAPPRK